MKTKKALILLLFVCIGFATLNETKAQSVNVNVNFSTFQNDLSPYGTWMDNPRFGQVWVYEDPNFKPYYTNGHWEYTSYGWSWVSDFEWGWAPFHYGRWEYDPLYGWMWIPGYEWASAWVSWSSYDDYYGWAPLGYGLGINISFGSIPYDRWTFIPRRNICDRDFYRYNVSHTRNNNFRNAVVINNYYGGREGRYFRGPDRSEVQRHTRTRIVERSTFRGRPQNIAIDHNRTRRNNDQNRVNNGGQRRNENTNGVRDRNNNRGDENNNQANNRNRRQERANNDVQRKPDINRQSDENLQRNREVEKRRNDQQQQMERKRNEQRQTERRQNDQQMERQRNEQRQNMERQRNEQRQNMDRQRNEQRQNTERQQRQMNPQREQRQMNPQREQRQMNPQREQRQQPSMERQQQPRNEQRGRGNGRRD